MASSITQFDSFLKEYYTKDTIEALLYSDRPLLGKLKRDPNQSGKYYVHPAIIGNPQGLGATRALAQSGATQASGGNVTGVDWNVPFGDYAGSVDIGAKVVAASRNDVGAFLRNQKLEIDRLYEAFADTFAYYVYADGGRALGTGTISTGVITLADKDAIANIEIGQRLVASADNGTSTGHTLLGSGSIGYVIAVNKGAGTFTVSATSGGSAGTPSGWTSTMFFFRDGDFGGTSTPNRVFFGLGAWVPAADPSATAFEGVVRTTSVTALSGVRLPAADYANMGIEQRIKLLVTRMAGRAGSKAPDCICLHPEKWQVLADSLESRGVRDVGVKEGKFGYTKLVVATGGGFLDVYADRFCPSGTIWALNLNYIKLGSYLEVPHVLNGDGLSMLRKSTTDDYEYRIVAWPAFCVPAPGYQGRIPAP